MKTRPSSEFARHSIKESCKSIFRPEMRTNLSTKSGFHAHLRAALKRLRRWTRIGCMAWLRSRRLLASQLTRPRNLKSGPEVNRSSIRCRSPLMMWCHLGSLPGIMKKARKTCFKTLRISLLELAWSSSSCWTPQMYQFLPSSQTRTRTTTSLKDLTHQAKAPSLPSLSQKVRW